MTGELARAESLLRAACGERLRVGFSMAPLTTFRVGGPASLYLEPESERDLAAAGHAVREARIPVVVIGKGSNVLVSDDGFPGLVIRLGKAFRWAARDGDRLSAGAAMPLPALAGVALAHSLSGLEFGIAIPGSLGGAVKMNAGAHGHELAEVLETIHVFSLRQGRVNATAAIDVDFNYRASSLGDDGVVVGATARLRSAGRDEIRSHMDGAREWRRRTQPLAEPNCGSVFKNPPGEHAARLVEEAGAKGLSIGAATVSPKHANFIVAAEGARASDVAALMEKVQELVADRFDVRLEAEVRLVGSFDLAPS